MRASCSELQSNGYVFQQRAPRCGLGPRPSRRSRTAPVSPSEADSAARQRAPPIELRQATTFRPRKLRLSNTMRNDGQYEFSAGMAVIH